MSSDKSNLHSVRIRPVYIRIYSVYINSIRAKFSEIVLLLYMCKFWPWIMIRNYLYGSRSFHQQAKRLRKTLISTVLRLLL
jgi:hypothetical protein